MDGHFVPNITIGVPVVKSLKRVATRPLDVHLMIEEPDRYIEAFAAAGADLLSVHVEVLPHLHRTVHAIKALGVKAGGEGGTTPGSTAPAAACHHPCDDSWLREEDIFELQHHHLLRCLEKATVSFSFSFMF